MTTTMYIALAVRHDDGLTAYGTFTDLTDARLTTTWLGTSDERVIATRTAALHPPDIEGTSPANRFIADKLIELPRSLADLLTLQRSRSTVDGPGEVVVLALLTTRHDRALLIGPFVSSEAARAWQHTDDPIARRVADSYLLPLHRSDLDISAPDTPGAPAVILLDTENASVAYGPFRNGMAAALFWHDFTTVITLTNVQRVYFCGLTPPITTTPPGDDVVHAPNGRTRGWVVRLAGSDHGEPTLVGPFRDEHSAQRWRDNNTASFAAVLPIFAQ